MKKLIIKGTKIQEKCIPNYKYSNIKFTLDEGLADILIVQETKLGPSKCDIEFIHKDYNMFRRDRISTDKIGCKNKKVLK